MAFDKHLFSVVIVGGAALKLLGIVNRATSDVDIVAFATDDAHTGSVHYKDLVALHPTADELAVAADWIRPQNSSPDFHATLDELIAHLVRQLAN